MAGLIAGHQDAVTDHKALKALRAEVEQLRAENQRLREALAARETGDLVSFKEAIPLESAATEEVEEIAGRRPKYRFEAGANYQSASVTTVGASGRIDVELPLFERDVFTLSVRGAYGETNSVLATQNAQLDTRYTRPFSERFYGFGLLQAAHDRIEGINYRLQSGPGAGYYWVRADRFNFFTEAGPVAVYENLEGQTPDLYAAGRVAAGTEWQVLPNAKLFGGAAYVVQFDDPANYFVETSAGLETKLSDNLSLVLRLSYYVAGQPAPKADGSSLTLTSAIAVEL